MQDRALKRRRQWGAGLALAASVVLGLGVVLRTALEAPDLRPAGPVPAPVASADPVPDARPREEARPSQRDPGAGAEDAKARGPAVAPSRAVGGAPAKAPDARDQARARNDSAADLPASPPAPRDAPAAAASAEQVASPAPASPTAAAPVAPSVAPPVASAAPTARPDAGAAVGAAETAPARPGSTIRAQAAPGSEGQRRVASAAASRESPVPNLTADEENALSVEDWLRRIVALRRAGRHADADDSLKRLLLRHPGAQVPAEARAR
ncbi:MAG: hypothetical protein JNM90_07205 [Burkholderiales bacterium]|nr:hypothetical protein [Burkholderiales bacterium]